MHDMRDLIGARARSTSSHGITSVLSWSMRAAAARDLRLPTPVSMTMTLPPACTTQSWIVTISRSMFGA